jgi:hypothetical protein
MCLFGWHLIFFRSPRQIYPWYLLKRLTLQYLLAAFQLCLAPTVTLAMKTNKSRQQHLDSKRPRYHLHMLAILL